MPTPTARSLRLRVASGAVALLSLATACGEEPIVLPHPLAELPQPPWMDEDTARDVFPALARDTSRMSWDPLALAVLKPDQVDRFPWPEHPEGRIEFRTNNRGFREDEPTETAKAGPRILVLGDSQTEGVVPNGKSFANRLEAALASRGTPAEVINGGVGATGPHNYLGLLLRHQDLRPDAVVVVIFTGNDFAHALQIEDILRDRRSSLRLTPEMQAARDRWPELLPQAFTQALLFHDDPKAAELAVSAALTACEEIARQCEALGARLLVALLPTRPDLDLDDEETVAEVLEAFRLQRDDLAVNARLGASLLSQLQAQGVETLDLRPALAAAPSPRFWRKDYHLNVTGHAAVARALLEALVSRP